MSAPLHQAVFCFRLHRVRNVIIASLVLPIVLASDVVAQNIDFQEFARRTASSNPSPTAQASTTAASYNGPTTGYPSSPVSLPSGSSDVQMQLASLQSQIASQDTELASLRRELKSPLATAASGAPRWYAGTEAVIVQPIQSNNSALMVRFESLEGYQSIMFPWELSISPRVYFGRESNDETLGWRMSYWQFRHTESFDASNANGLIPVGTDGYVGYLAEAGNVRTGAELFTDGRFASGIRTDVIDMELQRMVTKNIDLYAGLRYGKVHQTYQANTGAGNVNAASEFRGVGPSVAMRFQHQLPLNRLSLYADARAALMFGQQDYRVFDSNDTDSLQQLNGVDLRSGDDNINALVTNTEIQLGLRYQVTSCLNVHVGLESQYFGDVGGPNPVAVFTNVDGAYAGDSPLDDNLSFAGLAFGAELAW